MKHPFEEKVYKAIERAGLIEPGATVIVALSGGIHVKYYTDT